MAVTVENDEKYVIPMITKIGREIKSFKYENRRNKCQVFEMLYQLISKKLELFYSAVEKIEIHVCFF